MPTTKAKTSTKKRTRKKSSTGVELKYYKIVSTAKDPVYGTPKSACFDVFSCLNDEQVTIYNVHNEPRRRDVIDNFKVDGEEHRCVHLNPGDRIMVPTGLVFDIPDGHFVRLYSRSGLSLQQGLRLVNSVGVIDADYKNEVYILLENITGTVTTIMDETRLCQGELVKTERVTLSETDSVKNDDTRDGGFGSTGVGDVEENE